MSGPFPVAEIAKEYEHGQAVFVRKLESLQRDGWTSVYRAKGDGDCFYRSFAFGELLKDDTLLGDPIVTDEFCAS